MKILITKKGRSILTAAVLILLAFVGEIEIASFLSINVQNSEINSETEKENERETEIRLFKLNQHTFTKKSIQYSRIIDRFFALPTLFILQPVVLKKRRSITYCSLLI